MGLTPTQLIAASGLQTNLGIVYPSAVINPLTDYYSSLSEADGIDLPGAHVSGGNPVNPTTNPIPYSRLVRKTRKLLADANATISDSGSVTPTYITTVTDALDKLPFLDRHTDVASGIASGSAITASAQSFVGHLMLAQTFAATSFELQGSLKDASGKGFADLAFGAASFSEMVSGGTEKIEGVETPSLPLLDKMTSPPPLSTVPGSPIPADLLEDIETAANFGSGTGPFGNPTALDIVGSAAGYPYIDALTEINAVQEEIANTIVGIAVREQLWEVLADLQEYLDTFEPSDPGPGNPGTAPSQVEADALVTAIDALLAFAPLRFRLESATTEGSRINTQASIESGNLAKAIAANGPPNTAPMTFDKASLFAGRLHEYGVDSKGLGIGKMLERVANTSNIYGEAIIASLIEGRNIVAMQDAGVTQALETDPVALAKRLTG